MNFDLTDTQQLFQTTARQFVEKEYTFEARRKRVKSGEAFSRELWRKFGEMGWLGIPFSESAGGMGLSLIETTLIAEEIGRGQVLEPFVACGLYPGRILALATPSSPLLASLISGETVVAVAHSERQARGTVSSVATRATRSGDGWTIRGHKTLVIGAPHADWLLVSARAAGEDDSTSGVSLFLVRADAAGVTRPGDRLVDWSSSSDVILEDCHVDAGALLRADGAVGILQQAIDESTVALCAEIVGGMEGAIDATAEYIKGRKQFGVAISSFQALQHRMADMAIELMQARSMVYLTLQTFATSDRHACSVAASGCKALTTRIGKWVKSQGIQLHGGYGITEDYKVGQYFKRLHVIDAMFGNRDHHLNRYARSIVDQSLRVSPAERQSGQTAAR